MSDDTDRTASLMTPAKLAQLKMRPAPAASPAAWLDQLAADAGSGHVRRLSDLRKQLETQVREADCAGVRSACSSLAGALGKLDFALLQPKGWLARATGKGKEAAAEFASRYEHSLRAGEDLADELRGLQRKHQVQGGAVERTVLECEVEIRALDKIMEQGARWLQDMRNQLKAREAAGGDAATLQKIAEDTNRCELLVTRLKQLRIANSAAQNVVEQCRAVAARRVALLESLQKTLDGDWKSGQRKLAAVAEQATATGSAEEGVDEARRAQEKLTVVLQQAAADCAALQTQDQSLVEALAGLQQPLQAAA